MRFTFNLSLKNGAVPVLYASAIKRRENLTDIEKTVATDLTLKTPWWSSDFSASMSPS